MHQVNYESDNIIAPVMNGAGLGTKSRIGAFAATTSSARVNLATYLTDWDDGHFITLVATQDLYLFFNNADSGTADDTQVTAGNAGVSWLVPAYTYFHFRVVKDYSWLVYKASGACTVRVYLSSAGERVGEVI